MQPISRQALRYTAQFCEENIWWLAQHLLRHGTPAAQMEVMLFSNATQRVVLANQRAGRGGWIAWDYHVVLRLIAEGEQWVFDFDSLLPFPTPASLYRTGTFPPQGRLPPEYRTRVRVIPAAEYLRRLDSDRTHMRGRLPPDRYPDYPPITPAAGVEGITLAQYCDMSTRLIDGSRPGWLDEAW